jgi:hypothetical protein
MAVASHNTTLWDTDLLLEIAGLRLSLFEQLHSLGQRQLELIDQRDMTQLIHVLSAKHHVLAELQQTEKRLDPFRGQEPKLRRWRNALLRERCATVVEKSDQLLREILQQEKLAETRLEQHRNETAQRLQLAHSAGHARTAYAAPAGRPGMLDITTER